MVPQTVETQAKFPCGQVSAPPFGVSFSSHFAARRACAVRKAGQAGHFSLKMPQIRATQYAVLVKRKMAPNMKKTSQKPRLAQQKAEIVELAKTQEKPLKSRTCKLPALAKRAKKRRAHKLPVSLTVPEKDRLFKVIKAPRDRALFGLLFYHGLRASEPGQLVYSDYRPGSSINLDRLKITRLKGSVSCECALVPAAAQMLRTWVRKRGHLEGPLFPSRQRGPISRFRVFQLMRRYCAAAGIPREKWHPHTLKHSTAIHLLADQREGLVDVQRHLGHRDIKSTMRYLETLDNEFNEARIRRLATWR